MRIAIMQPYFIPYAGYFRLFQSTDLFVIYDCVQFIRRGWIHRNQLSNFQGEPDWLTLPLAKTPQETPISEILFSTDAATRMQEQMRKFPLFNTAPFFSSEFSALINTFSTSPVTYIVNLLKSACQTLSLPFNIAYSSKLNLSPEIKGQDRIIAIAKHFNADTYINAPGGKLLYDECDFQRHNIKLTFLSDYAGCNKSILARIFNEDIAVLKDEIISQSTGT